jgi:integrase
MRKPLFASNRCLRSKLFTNSRVASCTVGLQQPTVNSALQKRAAVIRVIPISATLQRVFEAHRACRVCCKPDDLVFATPKGTPLSSKNMYNRELAPACDRIKQPRVSWHSFRHTHATLLTEVGESIKTAQSLLGHSDLGTTLNTYAHAIPDSQRRAVEQVSNVLFSSVLKLEPSGKTAKVN